MGANQLFMGISLMFKEVFTMNINNGLCFKQSAGKHSNMLEFDLGHSSAVLLIFPLTNNRICKNN